MESDSGAILQRAVMKIVLAYRKDGIWLDETFWAS